MYLERKRHSFKLGLLAPADLLRSLCVLSVLNVGGFSKFSQLQLFILLPTLPQLILSESPRHSSSRVSAPVHRQDFILHLGYLRAYFDLNLAL